MKSLRVLLVLVIYAGVAPWTSASVQTLTNGNSVLQFDPQDTRGALSWTVDGVEQLYSQWFYFREGAAGAATAINTPTAIVINNSAPSPSIGMTLFNSPTLSISISYLLSGGVPGSKWSDVSELINITNRGPALSFFQYSDLDLDGTPSGDISYVLNSSKIVQFDGSAEFSETTSAPDALHQFIDVVPNILDLFASPTFTSLPDSPTGVPIGPDNVAWARQWDIGAGSITNPTTYIISKDKLIRPNPEPVSVVVWSVLALVVGSRVREFRRLADSAPLS